MADQFSINSFVPYDTIYLKDVPYEYPYNIDIDFYKYTGEDRCIAFVCPPTNNSDNIDEEIWFGGVYLDNITLDYNSPCHPVQDLAIEETTTNSITLSWEEQNEASQWLVCCTHDTITESVVTTSNPYTITNLTPNTTYLFNVSAICGAGDTSTKELIWAKTDTLPTTYTISTFSNDETMGNVTGTGSYEYGTTATLTATPTEHHHFVAWQDGITDATRTVTVIGDATYTATFEANIPTVDVVLSINYDSMGYTNPAAGTYTFSVGDVVSVEAIAYEGYHFVSWSVLGLEFTENPVTITVPSQAAYMTVDVVANFAKNNGINDIPDNTTLVYSENRNIIIKNAGHEAIYVYDVVGRMIAKRQGDTSVEVKHSGVYMVKVGDAPAQRVVVIR